MGWAETRRRGHPCRAASPTVLRARPPSGWGAAPAFARKRRRQRNYARSSRSLGSPHAAQLDELDGRKHPCACRAHLPRAADVWFQALLQQRQRFQELLFLMESRSTKLALLEPRPCRLSASCGEIETKNEAQRQLEPTDRLAPASG